MKIQRFKNYIGAVHEVEMSRVLCVPVNNFEKKGVDLLDSDKGVEVKGCLVDSASDSYKKNYVKWTLFDHELHWGETYKEVPLYCALGTYELSVPIEKIGNGDLHRLEALVTRREFWIVPWDWTLGFPIMKGKHHDYRYLRPRPVASCGIPAMPGVNRTIEINKGLLHFTRGVDEKHFGSIL
ncbi:hypothetical protein HNV12_03050 [Methanococcoides sp. SA1]|nr:hypothetical protein [Methanococcoides sp. SA1]